MLKSKRRRNEMKTLKILTTLLALFTIIAILPVFVAAQTTETNPQIKWDFGSLASQCDYPFMAVEITGRFETYVDLSNDVIAKDYIQQAIDAAIKLCPNIMKKTGISIDVSLYSPENKILITGKLDLASKKLEYRNYVVEAIKLSKAQKKAEEEIKDRLKKEGIYTSIDWQIIPSPLGGLNILGKSKVDVDLSEDTTARLYIATARDVALLRMEGHKLKFIQIYLYSPRGPQDKYYIDAFIDFDRGTFTCRNYAAEYIAQEKAQEEAKHQRQKNIDKYIVPFMKRHNVGMWFNQHSPVVKQLFANPYSLKGKVIGFIGKFESMASENSGYFWIGHEGGTFGSPFPPIVLKKIPSSKFTKPGEKFAMAARVEGITNISVPAFGQLTTVEVIFIAAEEPFPGNLE